MVEVEGRAAEIVLNRGWRNWADVTKVELRLERAVNRSKGRPVCCYLGAIPVAEAAKFVLPASMPHVVGREGGCRGEREGVLEGGAVGAAPGRNLGESADAKVEVQGTSNTALQQDESHMTSGEVDA